MKIYNLSNRDEKNFMYLVNNNLKNSVIFNFPKKFITNNFLNEITDDKNFLSLISKKDGKPAGIIIIKKKNTDFSINFKIITLLYAIKSFFVKDKNIFFKLYFLLFKQKKLHYNENYSELNSAEIIYICVDRKFRKKGIGKKLISLSIKKLKKNHKILITSSENSKEALNFYISNNFKKIGFEKRHKKTNILLIKNL